MQVLLLQHPTNRWITAPFYTTHDRKDTCLCLAETLWGYSSPWRSMEQLKGGLRALFFLTANLCLLLTSALKLIPRPHVQSTDLLQGDPVHFIHGCLSLLAFRGPRLLNYDGVNKEITWGVQGSWTVSNPEKESLSSDRHIQIYVGQTHTYVEQSRSMEFPLSELQHLLDRHLGAGTVGVLRYSCRGSLLSSQQPQVQSGHKFSITDTLCSFSVSFFGAGNASAWFSSCFSFLIG